MSAEFHNMLFILFPVLLAVAAVSDLMTMTISNRLCILIAAMFAIAAIAVGLPLPQVGLGLAAGAMVLAAGFAFFAFGWMGGGDVKLAAACALWLGFGQLVDFLCYTSILGGGLTLLLLLFRSRVLPAFASRLDWVKHLHDQKTGIPYGIAIAAAAMFIFPETPFLSLALR